MNLAAARINLVEKNLCDARKLHKKFVAQFTTNLERAKEGWKLTIFVDTDFLNPQAPVAQKNCGWGGFSTFPRWRSRVFLNRTSLTPHQIFDAHLLENTDLSSSTFHCSVSFISRSCFESDGFKAYSNEWDRREKNVVYPH